MLGFGLSSTIEALLGPDGRDRYTPRKPRSGGKGRMMDARIRIQAGVLLKILLIGVVALIFVLEAGHNRSHHTGLFIAHGSVEEPLQAANSR